MMNKISFRCKDIGRILIGVMFVVFGALKISGFSGTVGYIASAGIPMAQAVAVIAIIIELGGGLLLIANYQRKYAVYALTAWMIILTVVMHRDLGNQMQLGQFLKNLAIIGGLLLLCSCKKCSNCGDCGDGKCEDKNSNMEDSCCGGGSCCK